MAMKKILFSLLCILVLTSLCYATTEEISSQSVRTASEYAAGDIFFYHAYVYESGDADAIAQNIIFGTPVLVWQFWVPTTQTYYRHYIITDSTGTMVFYNVFSGSLTGSTIATITLSPSLPTGDYTWTGVVAGATSGMAVTHQVRFSVR
jgi:hypothetical protein